MKKSYFIFVVALLAAIVSFSAVFADGEKTLVVGFDQNFPPTATSGRTASSPGMTSISPPKSRNGSISKSFISQSTGTRRTWSSIPERST